MSESKKQRTLIVEDDPGMRAVYVRLFERLRDEGYAAVVVADGERALDVLQHEPVDLMVLDWYLPGISGETLLRALRAHPKTRSIGVLMVTGKGSSAEEVLALDSGADDHLAKPFDEKVFLARLRSLRRRREFTMSAQQASGYPGLDFDLNADLIRVEGRPVRLTPKELDVLGIFLHRPNIIHARAFLWESSWGYESDTWEHVLNVTISSLRRKLGEKWGSCIQFRKGRGYVFERPL